MAESTTGLLDAEAQDGNAENIPEEEDIIKRGLLPLVVLANFYDIWLRDPAHALRTLTKEGVEPIKCMELAGFLVASGIGILMPVLFGYGFMEDPCQWSTFDLRNSARHLKAIELRRPEGEDCQIVDFLQSTASLALFPVSFTATLSIYLSCLAVGCLRNCISSCIGKSRFGSIHHFMVTNVYDRIVLGRFASVHGVAETIGVLLYTSTLLSFIMIAVGQRSAAALALSIQAADLYALFYDAVFATSSQQKAMWLQRLRSILTSTKFQNAGDLHGETIFFESSPYVFDSFVKMIAENPANPIFHLLLDDDLQLPEAIRLGSMLWHMSGFDETLIKTIPMRKFKFNTGSSNLAGDILIDLNEGMPRLRTICVESSHRAGFAWISKSACIEKLTYLRDYFAETRDIPTQALQAKARDPELKKWWQKFGIHAQTDRDTILIALDGAFKKCPTCTSVIIPSILGNLIKAGLGNDRKVINALLAIPDAQAQISDHAELLSHKEFVLAAMESKSQISGRWSPELERVINAARG